jgi:hypothetical protein
VLAGEDLGQELALLLLGAHDHEGRADHAEPESVVGAAARRAYLCELFVEHHALDGGEPTTAVLLAPRRCQLAAAAELLAPLGHERVPTLLRKSDHTGPPSGEVVGEELPDLGPEYLGFGGIAGIRRC